MPDPNLAAEILTRVTADPEAFNPALKGFATLGSHAIWPEDPVTYDVVMGLAAWTCHVAGWYLTTDDMGQPYAYHLNDEDDERRELPELAVELLGLDNFDLLDESDRDAVIAGLRELAATPEVAPVDEGAQACDCHGAWHAVRDHCRTWPCPDCTQICHTEPA